MKTNYQYPNEFRLPPLNVRIPAWINSVSAITTPHDLDEERMKVMLHQFFLCYLKNEKLRKWHKERNFLDEYFPVSSELLKNTCTKRYTKYVQALEDAGVIEKKKNKNGNASYLVGAFAQLFRWRLPATFEGTISFKIDKVHGYKQVKSVLVTRDKFFKNGKQIMLERSLNNPIYKQIDTNLNNMEFDQSFIGEYEKHTITSDLKFLMAEAFANKDLDWFSQDEFGLRLHHPITALPKIYRNRLRFKDHPKEQLAVLDIKNSQPFFSSVCMNKHLVSTYLPAFLPVLPYIEKYSKTGDFLLYSQLCTNGQIYEFFMEGMGLNLNNQKERDRIKELLCSSVLFSRLRVSKEKKRFKDYFKSCFPSVYSMFQTIKSMDETILPELKEIIRPTGVKFKYHKSNFAYKLVSCLMQRAEAAMMFQVIAPRLIETGIKFVTVHDSFIVLPEKVEHTNLVIRESFESIGLPSPTLSIK